jgi:hypothetical protein
MLTCFSVASRVTSFRRALVLFSGLPALTTVIAVLNVKSSGYSFVLWIVAALLLSTILTTAGVTQLVQKTENDEDRRVLFIATIVAGTPLVVMLSMTIYQLIKSWGR